MSHMYTTTRNDQLCCSACAVQIAYLDVDTENRVLFSHVPETDVRLELVEDGDKVVDQLKVADLFNWNLAVKKQTS